MTVWQKIERDRLAAVESWVEEIQRWAALPGLPPQADIAFAHPTEVVEFSGWKLITTHRQKINHLLVHPPSDHLQLA